MLKCLNQGRFALFLFFVYKVITNLLRSNYELFTNSYFAFLLCSTFVSDSNSAICNK